MKYTKLSIQPNVIQLVHQLKSKTHLLGEHSKKINLNLQSQKYKLFKFIHVYLLLLFIIRYSNIYVPNEKSFFLQIIVQEKETRKKKLNESFNLIINSLISRFRVTLSVREENNVNF